MTINERVRQLRKSLNLSQEEFGTSIGLTKSGVSNIENGIRGVSDRHVKLLINSFNVNYDWLVYGEGEMFLDGDYKVTFKNVSDEDKAFVYKYLSLSTDAKKIIRSFVEGV